MASPLYERTSGGYGTPPYHESSLRTALRLLASGAAGLGAVPRGANFGEALLASAGASAGAASRSVSAAQMAAQEYAMKQEEARRRQENDVTDRAYKNALIENLGKTKPEKPPVLEPWQLPPDQQSAIIDYKAREAAALAKAKGGEGGAAADMPGLSSEALDQAALRYSMTGVMPSMGMGKQAAAYRAEIMNRAGRKYPASNIAANAADYQRDKTSLTATQRLSDLAASWEGTVAQNADVMIQSLSGIPDTGTRFGNKIGRFLASQAGSPAMARFHAAQETVKREYARLLSSPSAAGVLTDTSVRELDKVLGGDLTKPQLLASLKTLRQDAKNRLNAYNKQIQTIRQRLVKNPVGAVAGGGQQPQEVHWDFDPQTGELVPR